MVLMGRFKSIPDYRNDETPAFATDELNARYLISIKSLSPDCHDDGNREAAGCTESACVNLAEPPNDDMKVNQWECWRTKEF